MVTKARDIEGAAFAREARQALGLSQAAIGDAVGYTRDQVASYEHQRANCPDEFKQLLLAEAVRRAALLARFAALNSREFAEFTERVHDFADRLLGAVQELEQVARFFNAEVEQEIKNQIKKSKTV
jgi:transcriptional regulator with XRE-family HTH domain